MLFSPGQLTGSVIQPVGQSHPLQQDVGLGLHLDQGSPSHPPRKHHILACIKLRHEVEGLEDQTHIPIAEPRQFGRPQRLERNPTHPDRSRIRMIEPAHEVQQRALAGTRRTLQRDELSRLHAQIHTAEHLEFTAAEGIPLVDGLGLDERLTHGEGLEQVGARRRARRE